MDQFIAIWSQQENKSASTLNPEREFKNITEMDANNNNDQYCMKNKGTKKIKKNRYNPKWEYISEYKKWLCRSESSTSVDEKAYCKLCHTHLVAHKSEIHRHSLSKRHKFKAHQIANNFKITKLIDNSLEKNVRRAELKLCALLATNNLPFALMDTLIPLLKNIFTDSDIAKQLSSKRTKSTNIMKCTLGRSFGNELFSLLKREGQFFTIIMDETTDITTVKQCAFTIIYYDYIKNKIITSFFDIVEISRSSAIDLYGKLKEVIMTKNIPLTNLIGYSSDTTNVMFGEYNSVVQLLKADMPHIVAIKCSCHLIHLAASKACLQLPRSIEDLLRNIGSHFSRSYARIEKFKEFQEFFGSDIHKILSPSNTRWLSLKACVDRVLAQYTSLSYYFRETITNDPSITTNEILNCLDNKFTRIYLEFMSYTLNLLTDFNKMFQSEAPLLHKLKPECEKLLKIVYSNFIDLRYFKNADVFMFDHTNKNVHHQEIYLGVEAMASLLELKNDPLLSKDELDCFLRTCLHFYVKLASEIKKRFDFSDPLFDIISVLEPHTAQAYEIKSLQAVFNRFPFLNHRVNPQDVDNQWRQHALLNHSEYDLNIADTAEHYWQKVFNLKYSVGEPLFSDLKIVISLLLILPFSNASVERLFSTLKITKNDHRNRLGTDTLVSLFLTKEAVNRQGGCIEFEPTFSMLHMPIEY